MEKNEISTKTLKQVAGCFPTGVSVVSVFTPEGEIHGMTASSFVSVSLDPPLVMFSVLKKNQLASYLKKDMPLGISILTEAMEAVSNHFAKISSLENPPSFDTIGEAPILQQSHAWYATKVHSLIPAGDHHLVLCEVLDLAALPDERPLVYYQGYKKIAKL
ncbi:MAG: flavin reductase family protein [Flavobacteriaceae bacterium]